MSQVHLVSIIMPAYNAECFIEKAVESILKQTYSHWELLITDDGSTDGTLKIIKKLIEADKRIKLFTTNRNAGAGAARNNSIKQAKGRFIAFLDADDQWLPNKLNVQINFMLEKKLAFTFTSYQKIENNKKVGIIVPPKFTTYNSLLNGNVIGCLTVVYDTETLGKKYMPLIRKRQDMGLWLEILKEVPKAYGLQEVLALYRVDSGMTKNKFEVLKWQWLFYRTVVGLNFFRAMYHFIIYSAKGLAKYLS
ncbi:MULTISPECIES: glycosyltransferase family 2 protein [Pseudoalteromonas]|uniref:glycosyltransferase family 2 protein n=1 Tax=Pseudoalteromonas TaxID=53246 RepID=UPI00020A014F|nr:MULTISPECIES: glycosyltransferase family 2 protein [Pseudoalteromonas]EGI74682.1 putative N-acetylgalactosaminyl-diphosphoundecaprenol glucuronosyltransferase [Pseudoalteromonas distincta]MBB1442417.1 glycosyltransferase family 2 protein [Pseudoalteromonas sp. SG43-3]|tara:strand:- start:140 stop:889 length:750 start_codon:yes stop_codon:yes gene_type:complete